MNDANGGALIARTLARLGVTDIFALHGGHLDALLVACPDEGIRLVDCRHEATCGHAAEGYARSTGGRPGVALVTAGPGFANALTPMVSAWLDAMPVLFIAGSPPLREIETNPLQGGFDQLAMAAPVCKWVHRVTHTERIPDILEKALRIATTGRPGPVFVEVPIDVMFAPVDAIMIPVDQAPPALHRPAPPPAAIEQAIDLLRAARRPVLVAGGGTLLSPSAEPLLQFVEATGIPVASNNKAHGILPAGHPQYIGGTGAIGACTAAGLAPDVVVLLGARAGMFTGGRAGTVVPHAARLVQVDIDGAEIGRLRAVDIGIVADCSEALEALVGAASGERWPDRAEWVAALQARRNGLAALYAGVAPDTRPGMMHPFHAAAAVVRALAPDTTIITDGGESSGWVEPHVRAAGPGQFMTNGYLGCLGISQGFALGAAIARPGTPVCVFSGDGAVGFNIQEFDTMVRHRLPVLTVVMNNACWGMSTHGQDLVFGANRRAAVTLGSAAYDQVCVGFGGYGERVDRVADIEPAVRRARASGLPACLNLIIDPDVVHPVTPMLVGKVDDPDAIAIPYYENIPLRRSARS